MLRDTLDRIKNGSGDLVKLRIILPECHENVRVLIHHPRVDHLRQKFGYFVLFLPSHTESRSSHPKSLTVSCRPPITDLHHLALADEGLHAGMNNPHEIVIPGRLDVKINVR